MVLASDMFTVRMLGKDASYGVKCGVAKRVVQFSVVSGQFAGDIHRLKLVFLSKSLVISND